MTNKKASQIRPMFVWCFWICCFEITACLDLLHDQPIKCYIKKTTTNKPTGLRNSL